MVTRIIIEETRIEVRTAIAPEHALPLRCAEPGRIIPVPVDLAGVLASARWCVFEWTTYTASFPGADRLRVGSEWVDPTFPDIPGRFEISFANQLGTSKITPFRNDLPCGPPVVVEVLARKFATPLQSVEFLTATIADIFARSSSLPFEAIAPTARRVREHHRPPNLLFLYHFFRHHHDTLVRALQAIVARPHQVLTDDGMMVRPHEVRSLDHESITRLLTGGHGSHDARAAGAGASPIQRLQPERVFQRLPEETFDTPENRFAVMAAGRMLLDLDGLMRSRWFGALKLAGADRRPFDQPKEHLGLLTTDARFTTLPQMQVYPSQSRVLQRKDGYRELAQLWNLFQRASQPIFEDLQQAIDLRSIDKLYEYWVWFELIDRIAIHTSEPPVISVSRDEFGAPTHGQTARFGSHGTLHYNKSFGKGGQVYSPVVLRPDYVWEQADGRLVVLDAKFRLDNLGQLVTATDGDVQGVSAKAKDADLVKMHAYRDAIAGVTAAIVLYPGSEHGFWSVNGTMTKALSVGDVIEDDLQGVGAIPLLPTTGEGDGGSGRMTSDKMQVDAVGVVEATGDTSLIDEKTGWSRPLVKLMARSIQAAYTNRPDSWGIQSRPKGPEVALGHINIGTVNPENAWLLIDENAIPDTVRPYIDGYMNQKRYNWNETRSFRVLNFSAKAIPEVLSVASEAHLAAVRSLKAGKCSRWQTHREDIRKEFERIVGVSILEPGYMQQLRELKAAEALPPITSMYSRPLIEQMASSVVAAHDLGASSWSLFPTGKQIALNVGQEVVGGSAAAGKYDFVVDTEKLDPEQREWANTVLKPKPTNQYPSLLFLQLPNDIEAVRLSDLHGAHLAALAELTKVFKKATLWSNHQEDFRSQLKEVSGLVLPQPGYLDGPFVLEHVDGRRYWRFGRYASEALWSSMAQQSVVGIENWSESIIDLNELPSEHDAFIQAIRQFKTIGSAAAEHAWRIRHGVQPGDLVLGMVGRDVRGWGTVTGDYEYVENMERLEHQRPVEWRSTSLHLPLPASMRDRLRRVFDPEELTPQQFAVAIGATITGAPEEPDPEGDILVDPLPHVRDHFASQGLYYTDAQIATFDTALQTKGFVVLSGISGTGKSKIAQHFVELLPAPAEAPDDPADLRVLRLKRMPSFPTFHRVTLPARQIEALSFPDKNDSWPVRTRMDGKLSDSTLNVQWNGGARTVQLFIKGELRNVIAKISENGRFYGFVGLDDETGKISSVEFFRALPRRLPVVSEGPPETGSNHLFLPVRPDWRDSTSLLGYFNPLTGQYQWTDFLRFILRAVESFKAEDGLAWFVILDEMNLAHVEYYFADLLSVIESGRRTDPDDKLVGFTREPLRTSYPQTDDDDDVPPREIFVPPSLYIIGTVNMDETTHAFSPKVLDRAFTIELTEVDFTTYNPGALASAAVLDEAGRQAMQTAFTRNGAFARIDKQEVAAAVVDHPEIREHLQSLNELLMRNRFHFGYRIFDEIAQNLHNNDENGMMPFSEAFDAAVFMKVLPKFTGSLSRLRSPLLSLLAWAIDPALPPTKETVTSFETHMDGKSEALRARVDGAALPRVASRALQMLESVESDGFVSFG